MLNPEIAQARLKEYQVTDWQPVRLAKLAKLSAKLRSIGYGILAHDDTVGKEVFEILIASAKGEHEIGAMGRHIVRSILLANRPEGWEFVEKLLIAAQRQEGLRQSILEIPLNHIPPRIFSEVMRDLDLVVSVAHIGGVDPEASASTVEMRSSILRETCRLMKLNNIQIQGSHALIKGEIGTYSVHLGSAIVHRQPGGALCILPVSSQHRGRLFLPFVDDDPKTAEIMSKVLLLAKDKEIQDPTILEQILAK